MYKQDAAEEDRVVLRYSRTTGCIGWFLMLFLITWFGYLWWWGWHTRASLHKALSVSDIIVFTVVATVFLFLLLLAAHGQLNIIRSRLIFDENGITWKSQGFFVIKLREKNIAWDQIRAISIGGKRPLERPIKVLHKKGHSFFLGEWENMHLAIPIIRKYLSEDAIIKGF